MTLVQSTTHDFTASPLAFYGVRGEVAAVALVEKIDKEYKRGLILRTERDQEISDVLDFAVPTEHITNMRKQHNDDMAQREAERVARIARRKAERMLPLSA